MNEANKAEVLAYSPMEVAARLRISKPGIYRLIKGDHIPYLKIGRKIFIPTKEFEAWMAKRTKASALNGETK